MLSHWPIRTKLKLGLGLLLMTVLALFATAYYGLYAYRGLVKGLSARSAELPLAAQVGQELIELRDVLIEANERAELARQVCDDEDDNNTEGYYLFLDTTFFDRDYFYRLDAFKSALDHYRGQLDQSDQTDTLRLSDDSRERKTLKQIDKVLEPILAAELAEDWWLDKALMDNLMAQVELLRQLVVELPSHLHTHVSGICSHGPSAISYRDRCGLGECNPGARATRHLDATVLQVVCRAAADLGARFA